MIVKHSRAVPSDNREVIIPNLCIPRDDMESIHPIMCSSKDDRETICAALETILKLLVQSSAALAMIVNIFIQYCPVP